MPDGTDDPHADFRGGHRVSEQVDAVDVLTSSISPEPGAGNTARQLRLLDNAPVSSVPYGELQELARARIRRECRHWGFDWDAFVADRPEWGITEVVHRKAVQRERGRGRYLRPTDIPTDTVLLAVRQVIAEWTRQPELRPTLDDFRQEQARRGELGRETQQAQAAERRARVLALAADGLTNKAEIARRVGVDRSTVGRILGKADDAPPAALLETASTADPPPFPAPEIPSAERWPVAQFMKQTGVVLDAGDARWLADMGRCYEAEGREDELMHAIRSSADSNVRDPWAYLRRCVSNRSDAWTVKPQMLTDVLSWAGQKALEYALAAIGGGHVRRPMPYLKRTLQRAVASGQRPSGWPERPVAMATGMVRQWAPELIVVGADDAVAAEDREQRTGCLESYRRRHGQLPWEREPSEDGVDLDGAKCCIGLKGLTGDEFNYSDNSFTKIESSLDTLKANAAPADLVPDAGVSAAGRRAVSSSEPTPAPLDPKEPVPTVVDGADSDVVRSGRSGEALQLVQTPRGHPPRGNLAGVSKPGPCRHPLVALLTSRMSLADVLPIECSSGCGHQLYSDRGPFACPCHWSPAHAAQVAAVLQVGRGWSA